MKTIKPMLAWKEARIISNRLLLILCALVLSTVANAQFIVGWDFSGYSAFGASPQIQSNVVAGVTIGGLTRGPGVTTSGGAAGNAWGGNGWNGPTDLNGAIAAGDFITFSITPTSGNNASLSAIEVYNIRRSTTGPTTGQWQYQINSGGYVNIGSAITWGSTTSAAGNTQSAIDLSSIPSLQNVASGNTITFRIVNWGTTSSTGTWYLNDFSASGGNDLVVSGTVASVSTPLVTTTVASSIATNSANSGGNVTNDGGSTILARGIVWGLAANPTIPSVNSTSDGTGTGVFSSSLSSLVANTLYNYRAYATNSIGTSYGNNATFITLPLAPTATSASAITPTSFNANWTPPSMGGVAYTYSIEVSESNTFSLIVNAQSNISSGLTTLSIGGLNSSTDYYYRIRSVNSQGASVWSTIIGPVSTPAPVGPIVSTTPVTVLTNNSVTLNGTIDANGSSVNAFFDYGLTMAYGNSVAASPATVSGSGDTDISFNATGLSPNTTYNYRARANAGVFGPNKVFVTLASVPGVVTFGVPTSTSITINSVTTNGNPASTNFAISSPNFAGQYIQFNGTFGPIPYFQTATNWANTIIAGLTSSTSYTFQAIAQNSEAINTVAGPTASSTTTSCPTPTVVLSNISNNGGTITITNPTGAFEYLVNNSATAPGGAGTSETSNTVNVTGLSASTGYYAHVRSACGTNFSPWSTTPFTTLANPVGLVTYLFTGCNGCASSAATTADVGVTATDFNRGPGINANSAPDAFNNNGFNTSSPSFATADAQGDYLTFSVTANPGFQVTYTAMTFFHQRSGTGPGNTRIGYSTNGGTSWTYTVPDPVFLSGSDNIGWTFPSAFSTSNTVIFRIWAWGATGATGTYRVDNVILSGYVSTLCNSPVTQSTDVVFSNQTNTSADISWTTAGTSDSRKVFISNTTSGSPVLANGTDYLANSNFGSGDAVGSWFCVYSGTGNSVSVGNLLPGQTYRVFVANTNCSGIDVHYLNATATGNPANVTTTNTATPTLSSGPLSAFNTSCINFDTEAEVLISGSVLNGSAVTVSAPAGFALTLVSGENYTSSVTIPYTGDSFSTPVYVRFLPTAAITYSNNLTVSGGGAASISIPVSGTGINTPPSVNTGAASFIGTTGATLSGSLSLGCASVFSAYGIEYSVSPAFTPGNGAIVQSAFTGNNFSVAISNLGINTVYYYRAYGINNSVTYYGVVGSFSTLSGAVETIYNYGDNVAGIPFYVHPTVLGTNVAKSATGWTNSTACGSGYSGFGITSAATSYNPVSNPYVEVSISPNTIGNQVEIERISVQLRSTSSAANQVMLAYSIDGGSTWINRGVAETPAIGTACGVTSSNSWLLPNPVTVGSPLANSSFRIRLYYYNTTGAVLGNNQILNLVVLGRILQSPNTYYTISNGNFNDAIWSPLSNGTVGAQVDFTPEINAVIRSGHTVVLTTSDVLVKNLTVQSGANLRAASTDFSNMRNVSLYGNLNVIGSIGNGTTFDAIGLNVEGPNVILSGNGVINLGRIRKQSNFNLTSNLFIQSNVNVRFPGAAMYNNAPNSFFNINLDAGKSLNVTGSGGTDGFVTLDGVSGNDIDQKGGTYTINGTLNVTGNVSIASSNNINPYINSLNIGATGLVSVKNIDTKVNAVNSTTISSGGRLNVSGIMKHRQGTLVVNNGITLGASAILLHGAGTPGLSPDPGGLFSGNIKVRAQGTTMPGVYNYWSSPILNNSLSSIMVNGLPAGSAFNTYKYTPTGASSSSVEGLRAGWTPQTQGDLMLPGVGYITTSAGSVLFSGTPNNGVIQVSAGLGTFTNFNLVGNPYPGPIDAAAFMAANQASNIIPAIYFWDDDATLGADYATNDYIVTNAVGTVGTGGNGNAGSFNGRIAKGQSFFVEARSSAATINFDNSMRTTGSSTFFESSSAFEKLWLRVTGDNNLSNETLIAFGNEATDGYDDLYDAKKIAAGADIALYTSAGELNFAIQALSSLTESKIVPVGFDASQIGTYSFSISQMELINPTVLVYVEDRQNGSFHNLRLSDYTFTIDEAIEGAERFFLHFSKPITVDAVAESCSSNDGAISINGGSSNWNYTIMNSQNASIAQGVLNQNGFILESLNAGAYAIQLSTADGYSTTINTEIAGASAVQAVVEGQSSASVNQETSFVAISQGANTLNWDFGDGSAVVSGAVVNHVYTSPGIYTVTLFASNHQCTAQASYEVRVVDGVTGINDVNVHGTKVFPNPANERITILSNGAVSIEIADLTGKIVRRASTNNDKVSLIETSSLANGVYLVTLTQDGIRSTQRIVIAH